MKVRATRPRRDRTCDLTLPAYFWGRVRPFRIRYRLVGIKVAEAGGLDFTGRYLNQLVPGDPSEPSMSDYRYSFGTRMPIIGGSTMQMKSGAIHFHEFGIFPLRNGRADIVQFVGIEDCFISLSLIWGLNPGSSKVRSGPSTMLDSAALGPRE